MPQGEVIGSAWVEINSNIGQLQREIAGLKGHVDSSARNIETRFNTATKAISGMASVVGAIGMVKFGADVIRASTDMDQMGRALAQIEGGAFQASKRMAEFIQMAKAPGLTLEGIGKGYIQLRSVGLEAVKVTKLIAGVGNAIALAGGSAYQLELVTRQFQQMSAKGRVLEEDLRFISEQFPQIRTIMMEAFGTAMPEQLAKMGITATKFIDVIIEKTSKMPRAADSARNAQDNFRDSLKQFESVLGNTVLPTITKFLNSLTSLMDGFRQLPKPMQDVIGVGVMGGTGLAGILFLLNMIPSAATKAIMAMAGLGAKTAVAGGVAEAVPKYKDIYKGGKFIKSEMITPATGLMQGVGFNLPTIATATIMIESAVFAGEAIWKALKRDFTPQEYQEINQAPAKRTQQVMEQLKTVQMGAGNFPAMTFEQMQKAGAATEDQMEGWFEALGQSFQYWQNKTFADLQKQFPISTSQYKTPAGPPESKKATTTTTDIMEGFKKWESIQGEGYYATIDEKISKLKELRDAHKLKPGVLIEVNNTIKDLLQDRNDIYKQSYDEWQEILKSGQKQGFDIVTKGFEDIALRSGKQKIPVITETGAFTAGFELPETAKREIPRLPEKKPTIMEFMGTEDDLERLREWFAEQARLAKLNEDMIALSGELARKDEEYIANIKEKTQALDKAGMSAEDYAQALENVKKNTHEISQFKAEIKIKPDSVIDTLDDIEIKYEELYEKADRLNVSKLMVDQAKEADVKAIYDNWAISLDRTGTSMQGLADDWDDLTDSLLNVKEESKEISEFWRQMGQEGLSMIESVSDKTVESVFGKMFEKSDIHEAYKDYKLSQEMIRDEDERTGRAFEKGYDLQTMSFHEFSTQYRKEAELNTQSWSEFCKSMVEEFTKALIKMEIEAEARNVFDLLSGKGYGNAGGIGGMVKSIAGGGKNTEEIAGGVVTGGTTGGLGKAISKVAGIATPITAAAIGAYELGESIGREVPTTSQQRKGHTWLSKAIEGYTNVTQFPLKWGMREGSKQAREAKGIEPYPLAKGGIGIVRKPTPFIMGEAGPEMFNIQPLSKVQNEFITNKKDTYVNGNRSDNFNVYISFPNATLDSVDQNQIDRFVSKAIPSLRRAVSNGELS